MGWLRIFLLALCVFCYVAQADKCFQIADAELNPNDYFKKQIEHRPDRHKILVDKILETPNGQRPNIKELMNLVLEQSNSLFYRDQWESMFRSLWLSSFTFGELDEDDLCVFATVLNGTTPFENGQSTSAEFDCMLEESFYLITKAFYKLVGKALEDRHCPTDKLPVAVLPACYNPAKCVDGGRNYEIDDIWDEFDGNQIDLVTNGEDRNNCDEVYPLLQILYDSDNLFDNYVAAVFTTNAAHANWLWKSVCMKSPVIIKKLKVMSIFEDSLNNIKEDCTCDELVDGFIEKVDDYSKGLSALVDLIKNGQDKVQSHGHLKHGKGKRGNSHKRAGRPGRGIHGQHGHGHGHKH